MTPRKLDTLFHLASTITIQCDGLHNCVQRNDKPNSLFSMLSVDMVASTPRRIWISENEAREFFYRFRYSEPTLHTKKTFIQWHGHCKKSYEISEISSEPCFFWNSFDLIVLVGVVIGTRCMLWVAQKKAPDLYFRLRYSAQESDTAYHIIQ